MYCRKCGTQNNDNAFKCVECGEILQPPWPAGAPAQRVPTYLAHAILVTLFCCVPFGIVAIVYAAQVNGKLAAGNYAGAVDASRKAKIWCWVSFGIGLASGAIWLALALVGGLAGETGFHAPY